MSVKLNERHKNRKQNAKISDSKIQEAPPDIVDNIGVNTSIEAGNNSYDIKAVVDVKDTLNESDLFIVGDSEVETKGLIHHHINSMGVFYTSGIKNILLDVFKAVKDIYNERTETEEDKRIKRINSTVLFTKVQILKPTTTHFHSGRDVGLYPNAALQMDRTYAAKMMVDVSITATAYMKDGSAPIKREAKIENFKLCRIPIMVKSLPCNTYKTTKKSLYELGEDPSDEGGYFIVNGVEWAIDNIENVIFNKIRVFQTEGFGKEMYRAEFISKPGDAYQNQGYLVVKWLNDNRITCNIVKNKLRSVHIPFYVLFRLLGCATDKEIFSHILYSYDTPVGISIFNYLKQAYEAKYIAVPDARSVFKSDELLKLVVDELKSDDFKYLDLDEHPEQYQTAFNSIMNEIDTNLLPHIGLNASKRPLKARFLGLIIRKIFLAKLGILAKTDRDSYIDKRIYPAGASFAGPFKAYFNAAIIQKINRRFAKDFRYNSFSSVNLKDSFKNSIYGADFERLMVQSITSGTKAQLSIGKKRQIKNRLSTTLLARSNQLNTLAMLRQITTTAPDNASLSARANEMRRFHMTSLGFICDIHTPTGSRVGINKQLAMFASITQAFSSVIVKDMLSREPLIIPLNDIEDIDIEAKNLSNVYVNGDWIGCTEDSIKLVSKYRKLKRDLIPDPYISIYWENTQDEVYFWVDSGRMIRPLFIMYNNKRDPEMFPPNMRGKNVPFTQGIALSSEHIRLLYEKKITITDLLKAKVVEYVSPDEQTNYLICPNMDTLKEHMNNELYEYTHCDIPQAQFGITALTSPFGHHNQAVRVIYQGNQSRQTCGYFTMNWPVRCDKHVYLQYKNEYPLVKTAASRYLAPSGLNCVVAIMCNTGYNVEDSIIINKGAIDRGAYDGCKFIFYKVELEQKEEFKTPSIDNTMDIKTANYDKLVDGIIKKGSIVNKGDVLIGKLLQLNRGANDKYKYADKSVVYTENEQAVVHNIIRGTNEDDEQFIKVVLRKVRPVVVGDKFSVKGTSQVLTDHGWIKFEDLNIRECKIAALGYDGKLSYVVADGLSKYMYDGEMYAVYTKNIHIDATKNHKLYIDVGSGFRLERTYNVYTKKFRTKRWATYGGDSKLRVLENISIDEIARQVRENILTSLPDVVWSLDAKMSMELMGKILNNNKSLTASNISLINDLTRLTLHCGWTYHISCIRNTDNGNITGYTFTLDKENIEPMKEEYDSEYYYNYKGMVYCLEMPKTHQAVYFSRETPTSPACWTGNSSRHGQKGICALLMPDADMPRTKDGMAPFAIINPHALPSRMTIGQLIESLSGTRCAMGGSHLDATMFNKVDIDSISAELEQMGYHSDGYQYLYNGITGEMIHTKIYIGSVFYQRIQKFVKDQVYSACGGPRDIMTGQPLSGMSSKGGLRIGEMEVSALAASGMSRMLSEKFTSHSDGYKQNICRCGRPAVVNHVHGIYSCQHCGDMAHIGEVSTTQSSKLLFQEMDGMNVGVMRLPPPYTYQIRGGEKKEQ